MNSISRYPNDVNLSSDRKVEIHGLLLEQMLTLSDDDPEVVLPGLNLKGAELAEAKEFLETTDIFAEPEPKEPKPSAHPPGIYNVLDLLKEAGGGPKATPVILEYLVVNSADDFLKADIPPREVLLETIEHKSPVLYAQSINQIFAWRGTGKTNVTLAIAGALATGGTFLRWKAPKPCNVLYVEGELPAAQMQERLRQIVGETDGRLRIVTLDAQPNHEIPSLAGDLGQKLIEDHLQGVDVLILDSISTLFNFPTNDEEQWLNVQRWFQRLRSRGLAIIFLHHAGKSGLQRGSSKSEDMLDVSIKLSQPKDYTPEDGLRCVLEFDKVRGTAMLDGQPMVVRMETNDQRAIWTFNSVSDEEEEQAFVLYSDGATVRQVADEIGCSVGKASKLRRHWEQRRDNLVGSF